MSWCRAAWMEDEVPQEGTIPSIWIEENYVRWPSGTNVLSHYHKKNPPQESWWKYPLIKKKCWDDDYDVCENFDFTSTDEASATYEKEGKTVQKKVMKQPVKSSECQLVEYPTLPGGSPEVLKTITSTFEKHREKNKFSSSKTKLRLESMSPKPVLATEKGKPLRNVEHIRPVAQVETPKMLSPLSTLPIEKFQYKVLHKMTEMSDDIKEILNLLRAQSTSFNLKQYDNIEEFRRFDNSLASDEELEKNVKLRLSNLGGASCHTNVRSMMAKLMTNNLMSLYSLAGQGEKFCFRDTNLMKIVRDCTWMYDERTVDQVVGKILIRAPDRKGGGGRKRKRGSGGEKEERSFQNQNVPESSDEESYYESDDESDDDNSDF